MPLEAGSSLNNRYRVERQLGEGGMGAVYLAYDESLQIKVAIKENLNVNPQSERQFQREASLLATTRHPHLPRVIDHFILEGRQYLVMDFIEGDDLRARLKRDPPNVEEVLGWAQAVCDALAHLHSRNPPIIHRDIKPSNIKLQPDGTVVLVDFGLAKEFDEQRTSTGARGMTPGYSPPEQYGASRTDSRSDQYALAATMYALLTKQAPEEGIERMLGNAELTPPRQLNPEIPKGVEAALTRGLSVSPQDRFPDVSEFGAALSGHTDAKTVTSTGEPAATPTPEPQSSPRWWIPAAGLAGLAGLTLIGGIIGLTLGGVLSLPIGFNASGQSTQAPGAGPAATGVPDSTAASGTVAEGGTITYTSGERAYRVEASQGAAVEDIGQALEELSPGTLDTALNMSPDGGWLILETDRFRPDCPDPSSCLALIPSDLSSAEVVRPQGEYLSFQGKGAVASGGDLIVYSGGGGPNDRDLWSVQRTEGGWSAPLLLTADSPFAWNHEPAVSADGTRILFDCGPEPYGAEGTAICEAVTDGSGFRVLVQPEDGPSGASNGSALHHPDYGPEGAVVFEADWNGQQIWRVTSSGGSLERISLPSDSETSPCVLADGRIVSVWRGESEALEFKVMNPDGAAYFVVRPDTQILDVGIGCGG